MFEFTVLGLHLSLIFSIFSKKLLLAKISWLCRLHVQSECWTLPGIWFGVWVGVWWSEQYESQHIKGCGSLPPLLGWGTVLALSEGVRGGSEVVVALAAVWALSRTAFTLTWSWALVSDWTNDWQMPASKMSFCEWVGWAGLSGLRGSVLWMELRIEPLHSCAKKPARVIWVCGKTQSYRSRSHWRDDGNTLG